MGGVSEPSPSSRPHQVTLAAWLTMVGSVIVVVLVYDRIAGLHTLETRQSVEKVLADAPGLGIGVDGVLTVIRTLAMVTAGCATAAAVLGYQVLRRSRSARLALTVVAIPLAVGGLATGGFVSSVVAASVVMLWLQPARDWFDGVVRREPSAVPPTAAAPTAPTTSPPPPPEGAGSAPAAPPSVASSTAPLPLSRPPTVAVACALTWITSGLTVVGMVLTGVLVALRPDTLLDEVHRQNPELAAEGVTNRMLVAMTIVMIAGIVLWCLVAAVLAILVFRRTEWARIVLVISAAAAAALSLVGTAVGAFLLVFTLIASVVTLALLLRPETRGWFQPPR
jgi:hypothetical protein